MPWSTVAEGQYSADETRPKAENMGHEKIVYRFVVRDRAIRHSVKLFAVSKERTRQTFARTVRHRIGRSFPLNSRSPFGVRRPVELAPDIFPGTTRDASGISGTSLATDLAPAASFSITRDAGRHARKGNPRVLLSAPAILCSV